MRERLKEKDIVQIVFKKVLKASGAAVFGHHHFGVFMCGVHQLLVMRQQFNLEAVAV